MKIRQAMPGDIPVIQQIRNAVKENVLSDPSLVSDADCFEYITNRGMGWVWEEENQMAGFAIADLKGNNIWALFLRPEFEGRRIGRQLHDTMLDWYFLQTNETVWLSTSPGTRAETFYKKSGWREAGTHGNGEIKFEMSRDEWTAWKSAK